MDISSLNLFHVTLPLARPFETHQGTLTHREVIIVKAIDYDGVAGFGEVHPFTTPFYTAETIQTAWHILTDVFLPVVDFEKISHPSDVCEALSGYHGHQMAKAGLEGALWDLFAKQKEESLSSVLGGTREVVQAGVALSLSDDIQTLAPKLKEQGYQKFKVKVTKGKEHEQLQSIREVDPSLPVMIDANGMYSHIDFDTVVSLDNLNLMMIEQPFPAGDFIDHRQLQTEMKTPICLDESIMGVHDAYQAIMLEACRIINIKIGRVGGLTQAKQIHDLCDQHAVPVWSGGMVETGISKAHHIALASLNNFTIPADLTSSSHFFDKDLVEPPITVESGQVSVPDGPGIGFEVDEDYVHACTVRSHIYKVEA
ncbi:o-succinylbenzoate synthase [Thalassobacillus sp. CUG 92003]|uniref:o-succinylbenzoate synthase n=1 Tax=Thalassobacillus sp. CUG 92003 TaxID=2736641 RepID=UPI0015E7CB72|nr:o-succinylbenzoate synthase [Thalassobacillus sp. CUG 92003]